MSDNKRIAKNSLLLYIRMAILMLINLYSVRVVLNAMGVEDYGIYNAVSGIITLLSSLPLVLSSAIQRFYSVALGDNNSDRLKSIFSASINIFLTLSFVVVIIGETVGLWFMKTQLTIPLERMNASLIVYQASIFTFIASFLQIPYLAASIAHEDMGIYTFVSTFDCVLKLLAAVLLNIVFVDKLALYGIELFVVSIISFLLYLIICKRRYSECHYSRVKESPIYKQILSFSGWTLFGSVAGAGMLQGNTLLVNIFFGPVVNASRAISLHINSALNTFCSSFVGAIRPPMVKAYTKKDINYLNSLFNISNKFVYYSLLIICMPLFFEMETILRLWLKSINDDMIVFSKLIIIYTFIVSLHHPITIIIQATGKVKNYFVPVETITLLSVPLTYIAFKLGLNAVYTFHIMIILAFLSHIVRLICLKKTYSFFSITDYFKDFIMPALAITIICGAFLYFTRNYISNDYIRFFYVFIVTTIILFIFLLTIGVSKLEKDRIIGIFKRNSSDAGKFLG